MQVTTLTTLGPVLAKRWLPDGTIKGYDEAKRYKAKPVPIDNLEGLHGLLARLSQDPRSCIIRGQPAPGVDLTQPVLRRIGVFEDRPSHLFMVDVDKFEPILADPNVEPEAALEEFVCCLPAPFHGASYVWQLSGSAGHPSAGTKLKAHLWFWLKDPVSCEYAEAWSRAHLDGLADPVVHRTVQINYTAEPFMVDDDSGLTVVRDMLAGRRLGYAPGWMGDTVDLGELPITLKAAPRVDRGLLKRDLADKPGLMGAFFRAFSAQDVLEDERLLGDQFAPGSTDVRWTWLGGGGSAEGVRICDSGMHLVSTHATWPLGGRAANLWDVVRVLKFGHLDSEDDAEGLEFAGPSASASEQAMRDWARTLPEVMAEMNETPVGGPKGPPSVDPAARAAMDDALRTARTQAQQARLAKINAATDASVLESVVARELAQEAMDPIEREAVAKALQTKVKELADVRLPIATTRSWLKGVKLAGFEYVTDEGKPLPCIENLETLIQMLGATVRYNAIKKAPEILFDGIVWSKDNTANAALAMLSSEAEKVQMPTRHIIGQALAIADKNLFNPVLEWIESAPWDGVDRTGQFLDTVSSPMDAGLKRRLMMTWAATAVAVVASETPIAPQGMLVFQGEQGQGKTRWLQSLVEPSLGAVLVGHTLRLDSKDTIIAALRHWLVELGELDATFKRSEISALKSHITQDMDVLRLPYAVSESTFPRRTVYFGSVNDAEFLHDQTGNRRYWVIPVTSVAREHDLDCQQFWAQVLVMWRAGELSHFLDDETVRDLATHNEGFTVTDPIIERIGTGFPWDAEDETVEWQWMTATQILAKVGIDRPLKSDVSRVGSVVRKFNGGKAKRSNGIRLLAVPVIFGSTDT